MVANIVVCADGTWNRPEEDLAKDYPTNVLRLARAVSPEARGARQHVFYDWGLGSYHDGAVAGAIGRGIHKNIVDGYRYIVHNYAPGDRIFLFGFSRGAYTVRALCGLIHNCGIVRRADARLIARAWRMYKSPARANRPGGDAAGAFREAHSHPSRDIDFVGVWDTVGALGIPFSLMGLFDGNDEFYDNRMGANVRTARHALAIDERREDFEPTLWQPKPGVDLQQVWFAGCHADVGGGYAPDDDGACIGDVALGWMLREADRAGLAVEEHLRNGLTDGTHARIHRSRVKVFRLRPAQDRGLDVPGIDTTVHPSVRQRFEMDSGYRPKNLVALLDAQGGWDGVPGMTAPR
ncbi:MAG: DUF2235 domain-containing protein [Gammaproteobacteria bacterium]|nr:DUF2235 domain-containing protein [Gammaproteobacteria bacterium]